MYLLHNFWSVFHYDYLDCFIPFVSAALRNGEQLTLRQIKEAIRKSFSIDIPAHPLSAILTRSTKRKAIILSMGRYHLNRENANKFDLTIDINEQTRNIEQVISSILDYLNSCNVGTFTRDEIERSFLSFISDFERELFEGFISPLELSNIKKRNLLRFHISKFILKAQNEQPELFSSIMQITVGQVLSSALFSVHDEQGLEKYRGKLTTVSAFLDSRFIIRLLGLEGEQYGDSCGELVKAFKNQGAQLKYCAVTKGELDKILWMFSKSYSGVSEFYKAMKAKLARDNVGQSRVDYLLANLVSELRDTYNVLFEEHAFETYSASYQIDEMNLYNRIVSFYKANNAKFSEQDEKERIERDVKVIAEIYQARQNNTPHSLSSSNAFFVTTNSGLARVSREFDDTIAAGGKSIISPVMTDVFVGTLVWIQHPTSANTISQKRLIALCNAAIKPTFECLRKYVHIVESLLKEKVISEEKYAIAIAHRAAINMLEDISCGCADDIGTETVEDIIDKTFHAIREDEARKTLDEQQKRIIAEKTADCAQNSLTNTLNHFDAQSKKAVLLFVNILKGIITILVALALIAAVIKFDPKISIPLAAILFVISLLNLKNEWTIDRFCKGIATIIHAKLRLFFLPKR